MGKHIVFSEEYGFNLLMIFLQFGQIAQFKYFHYGDQYAFACSYAWNIQFKKSPPSKSVNFLEGTVNWEKQEIWQPFFIPKVYHHTSICLLLVLMILMLFWQKKETPSQQYLHKSIDHILQITKAFPKTEFIRIHRIHSNISDLYRYIQCHTSSLLKIHQKF